MGIGSGDVVSSAPEKPLYKPYMRHQALIYWGPDAEH